MQFTVAGLFSMVSGVYAAIPAETKAAFYSEVAKQVLPLVKQVDAQVVAAKVGLVGHLAAAKLFAGVEGYLQGLATGIAIAAPAATPAQ